MNRAWAAPGRLHFLPERDLRGRAAGSETFLNLNVRFRFRFPALLVEGTNMKKHQLRPALVVFALCAFVVFTSPSWAITANWTNAAANNTWETAGNWNINQVPNNNL